ncbi:MBL fold metallo-hydrolase RNA specificity domain-containing protein [Sphaerochaeta halotolerans]|uniref:MBL fold metallo-hydrolase RNA specificity domain-containing protein n=1 Tax=Sphaerochaeta halotolerans TaxID=2293840 RepID=UPI00136D8E5E|nr:MBL fold metallo-hydrolase [Sphaerochaeta halotolerans]MXI87751.1 MBL fold metallo-hydrolase [Sphaerochaeta halotolerans]
MFITFFGAAQQVTGSCTLVEVNGKYLLVDCGLPQGNDEKESGIDLPFDAHAIDYVFLTHAHIDHSGRIPLLVKEGFEGKIFCTSATVDLCEIMLADSGHIHEMEAEWKNRKAVRAGKKGVEALYTVEDAKDSMRFFSPCDYETVCEIDEGIKVRFNDAGHLLGSSSIEMWLSEGKDHRKLVFSGDIGNFDQPLIKDPDYIDVADFVVMESTYGNRVHKKPENAVGNSIPTKVRAQELADIIERTFKRGGNVIIPAFAVGRTQEMLYLLRVIIEKKLCPTVHEIPVFVDSPLSVKATHVFAGNLFGYMDEETMKLVNKGINPILFPSLVTITDVEGSKALNRRKESCVIISSSGMCEAGRIKHHLKHNLWRSECTVLFSGYQAGGTLGRSILEGARHVTIFGEQIDVRCEVKELHGISGHADQKGLVKWLTSFKKEPRRVFIVHGDKDVAPWFASYVSRTLGIKAYAPKVLERFDLLKEETLPLAEPMEEIMLPYFRELNEALAELKKQEADLLAVVQRLENAGKEKTLEEKRAQRLTNAINRLASDLEYLKIKWGVDAD